jgi:hypothetical protein
LRGRSVRRSARNDNATALRAQAIQAGQHQFLELPAAGGEFSDTLHTPVRIIEEQ